MERVLEFVVSLPSPESFITSLTPESLIWGAFYIVFVIFIVYSLLLLYHWIRYGSLYAMVMVMMIIYFGVSVALIGTAFGAAITLT